MTTEDAPVGVQLIDDDVAEVGEQLYPACVMWQDAGVEHVGIGDDDVAGLADGLPCAYWCVAVVGVGLEVDLQLADQTVKLGQLILRQRLRRKKVERPRLGVAEHRLQDGQVVAGGLPGRGRGDHHEILARQGERSGLRLVRVQPADPSRRQRLPQSRIE